MDEAKRNNTNGAIEDSKKKERHIVSWSQEEEDVLRQQISLHGTENWAVIASKFKDKTTRQCRRRWYTYLNSDFKKGGWSPEEDMLLCEAQRIYGNRWTEIAKVVSGRTDNAVKNRFSTLCKKRAKYEALVKETKKGAINLNNKRIMFYEGLGMGEAGENAPLAKKIRRSHLPNQYVAVEELHPQSANQQPRAPFSVLQQNSHNDAAQHKLSSDNDVSVDDCLTAQDSKSQGTFLRKDDPKVAALMQQAELLGSLAMKINSGNTDQSLENAWKVLQDFLRQGKENNIPGFRICELDIQLEDFKELIEDLWSANDGSRSSWREPGLYEDSPASSDYSTGSTLMPYISDDKIDETQVEIIHHEIARDLQMNQSELQTSVGECEGDIIHSPLGSQGELVSSCDLQMVDEKVTSSVEFGSPIQVTPLFRSLAAGIPSPKFSESERSFLLKTLGMESPCPNQCMNPSQPPSCKRALLQNL